MTEDLETASPAEAQAEQVENVDSSTSEETTDNVSEETSEPEAKKEPWQDKRIRELTRNKYELKEQINAAAQEAQKYREQLDKLQSGENVDRSQDVDSYVKQEAAKLVAEEKFNDSCNRIYDSGKKAFNDFDEAVSNLGLVGLNSKEFFELAASSDDGAKLINHLGHDLEEAARFSEMTPVQMARELTKLEFKLNQKSVKPVSNAPSPISPVGGSKGGSKSVEEMSDAEFAKMRRKQVSSR